MIDNLSNGRVAIACASGWHGNDFVLAPDTYKPPRPRFTTRETSFLLALCQATNVPLGEGFRGQRRRSFVCATGTPQRTILSFNSELKALRSFLTSRFWQQGSTPTLHPRSSTNFGGNGVLSGSGRSSIWAHWENLDALECRVDVESSETALFARLAYELTICARDTYEVGTDRVAQPELLRAYNELLHRVTGAATNHLLGREGYSVKDTLEMLRVFGEKNGRVAEMQWAVEQAAKSI